MPRRGSSRPDRLASIEGCRASRAATGFAQVGPRGDLDLERRQALDADGEEIARAARTEVVAHAGEQVPPGGDRAPVQQLDVAVVEPAVAAFAFAAQPGAMQVGAEPALRLPGLAACAGFDMVEQQVAVDGVVVHRMHRVHVVLRQREGRHGQRQRGEGGRHGGGQARHAHDSTRTSRIIPVSMW